MSPDLVLGMLIGASVMLAIFLPWCQRLERENDRLCERHLALLDEAMRLFEGPTSLRDYEEERRG